MKRSTTSSVILLLAAVLFAQDSHSQDYLRWRLPEGARMRLGKGNVLDVAWSPDRTRLAAGGTAGIWVYNALTGAEISLITGHSFRVNAVAFSPDGLTLASGSRDDTVRLWDVATGEEKSILTGHRYDVEAVAFSQDGTTVASGSRDGTVRLWDVTTGQERGTLVNEKYRGKLNSPWGRVGGFFAPMVPLWPAPIGTVLCVCGTWPQGRNNTRSQHIPTRSGRWPFRQTV